MYDQCVDEYSKMKYYDIITCTRVQKKAGKEYYVKIIGTENGQ